MNRAHTALLVAGVVIGLSWVGTAQQPSADWPQWRGSNRDAAASFAVPAMWPEQLIQRWKVEVGIGYATPLIVGNRIYMFSRQGENEVMSALDAATGATVWQTRYAAAVTLSPPTERHGKGPKSTPAFANGRLYSIGTSGIVTAFDAATGRQLWQKPGTPAQPMFTNNAFSPIVDRGLVIFHVGGDNQGALTAYDANTGDVKWQWTGDGPGYGSPVVADLGGVHQVVTITQRKVVGVDAATGVLLWERTYGNTNAMTPLLYGETVIVGGGRGTTQAFSAARSGNQWTTTNVWENADAPLNLSNALVAGDAVFALTSRNQGQYISVDAKTGRTLWTSEPRQTTQAAIVRAGNVMLSLQENGELVVFRSGPMGVETLKRYKVAESDTWTPPTLSGNRIFVKDLSTLTLWTLN